MKKIIFLVTLAISALTASAQNWTSFNSFGFQRKINGTDTTYRVLGAGVNTPYLYLKSDWSKANINLANVKNIRLGTVNDSTLVVNSTGVYKTLPLSQLIGAKANTDASNIIVSDYKTALNISDGSTLNNNISGNASTVTNGVYTTGSYANPSWLTSLDWNKITNKSEVVISTGDQTIGGIKTFNQSVRVMANDGNSNSVVRNSDLTSYAKTDASNINLANYKSALGLPSTGGYDLQSVTDRGAISDKEVTISNIFRVGSNPNIAGNSYLELFNNSLQAILAGTGPQVLLLNPSGGNVGVGTTSATAKLDVNGSIRASGNDGNANSVVRNSDLGNYVTTNTSQTGLGGDKTWTGNHTFNSVRSVGSVEFGNGVAEVGKAKIFTDNVIGTVISSKGGTNSDFLLANKLGLNVFSVPTGTVNAVFMGNVSVNSPLLGAHATNKTYVDGVTKEVILNVSSNWTISDASFNNSANLAVYVDASTAPVNIILPAVANTTGKKILIFKTDSSANAVTINGPGALIYINGSPTYTLTSQYASVEIHANSTQYYAK